MSAPNDLPEFWQLAKLADGRAVVYVTEEQWNVLRQCWVPTITFPDDMPMSERIGDPRIDGKARCDFCGGNPDDGCPRASGECMACS